MSETLECCSFEFLAELGSCDRDQEACTLCHRLSSEIDSAILGYDEMCLETSGNDASALGEERFDLIEALGGGGEHSEERDAPFGERRTEHEVMLATDAREDSRTDRIGTDLTGEVYFEARIDRHDFRVCSDDVRIVGPSDITEHDILIAIHKIIEGSRAEGERSHRLSG